jgi:hypothetical protein
MSSILAQSVILRSASTKIEYGLQISKIVHKDLFL